MIIESSLILLGVFRYLIYIMFVLYIVFALVVVRQVQLMVNTLEVGFENGIRLLALIHLFAAIGAAIFVFLLLQV